MHSLLGPSIIKICNLLPAALPSSESEDVARQNGYNVERGNGKKGKEESRPQNGVACFPF